MLPATQSLAAVDVGAYLANHEDKQLLRLVVIGSVDDGKSTLIGRLLHDAHGLYDDQVAAVERASARGATRGDASASALDYSLVTDGLRAEREQGITIDVAYRYFATARRKFVVADTPGHVQYTRNMATGASTADVAVILIDARLGILPQTLRHTQVAALLGIRHLVVCVNKMDLIAWDQSTFDSIGAAITTAARELGIERSDVVPISALRGDFVVAASSIAAWYRGPALLPLLESIVPAQRAAAIGLRFPVQYVIRPNLGYRGLAAQIAAGDVRVGDAVVALPSGRRTQVTSIDTFEGPIAHAVAPMSVTLRLADELDIARGDMLVTPEHLPTTATHFAATVVWMADRPLDRNRTYLLKHTTRVVRADIVTVAGVIDPETQQLLPAAQVALNDIAAVEVACHQPLFFDPYSVNRSTGCFILIDALSNDTVGAGMIRGPSLIEVSDRGHATVTASRRRARLGQRGAVIEVGGDHRRALAIEADLFAAGRIAAVVDAGHASAVAATGVLAVVAGPGSALCLDGDPIAPGVDLLIALAAADLIEPTFDAEPSRPR
jgi:bifunctional enzyme CysN/CysC